ncbi:MAG: zinc-dependent peptidase [Planctomycetota bacterium]
MFGFRRRRRARLRATPVPSSWNDIIARNVPYVRLLDDDERRRLLGEVRVFLDEKEVVGCGGLEITDEIRVTIAAQACLLLIGRESDVYPMLGRILVYPHPYRAHTVRPQPDGTVVEGEEGRLGESWHRGALVLAWDAVVGGARDVHDGHNVVLHEFAHQLDSESGGMEGAPLLPDRAALARWARVMTAEYAELLDEIERDHRTVMDRYGATNPAEFFAVATETFFEKPRALARRHAELYALLRDFYGQDPARRFAAGTPDEA